MICWRNCFRISGSRSWTDQSTAASAGAAFSGQKRRNPKTMIPIHSPAPWSIEFDRINDATGKQVAQITPRLTGEQNHKLIAAAPELLAALAGILQWWTESDGGDDMPVDLFDRAQAALKAAKGGTKRIASLSDIKEAVLAGKTVHWKTEAYRVVCDSIGQWLIVCQSTNGCWGLTWADGVTMNGAIEDFFVGGAR